MDRRRLRIPPADVQVRHHQVAVCVRRVHRAPEVVERAGLPIGREHVRVGRVEAAGPECDRMDQHRRGELIECPCPALERRHRPLLQVGLEQRRPREGVEARPELGRRRRVGVDAVVRAVVDDRLLDRLADAHANDRARPRVAGADPRVELVRDAERRPGARHRRRVADEAEVDRRKRRGRRVDRVERQVSAAEIEREVIRERPAARVGEDVVADAAEEAGPEPDSRQEVGRVAALDEVHVREQVGREVDRLDDAGRMTREREPQVEEAGLGVQRDDGVDVLLGIRSGGVRHGQRPRRRIPGVREPRRPARCECAAARVGRVADRGDPPLAPVRPRDQRLPRAPVEQLDEGAVPLRDPQPVGRRLEHEHARSALVEADAAARELRD